MFRKGLFLWLLAAMWLATARASAVTLTLDYSLDTGHFFAAGSQSRTTLEAAAGFYSSVLNDTLSAIQPPVYQSSLGPVGWHWTMALNHPSGSGQYTLQDQTIAADAFVIFAGAKSYSDSTLAVGSPGLFAVQPRTGPSPGSLPSAQAAQIYAIDAAFADAVTRRGETSGFADWGGAISFDNDSNWHYDYTSPPPTGKVDLYSVAIHELAHTLGFGTSTEWNALVTSSTFNGNAAKAAYGGPVPLATGNNSHWREGLGSTVYGGTATQTAVMTPGIAPAIRKKLTTLDAAALTDLGWELIAPLGLAGDYNHDGTVNAADYTVWRNTRGMTGAGMAADGNHNNMIDAGDFTIWKTNFGVSGSASGTSIGTFVPEPSAVAQLLIASWSFAGLCGRRRKMAILSSLRL